MGSARFGTTLITVFAVAVLVSACSGVAEDVSPPDQTDQIGVEETDAGGTIDDVDVDQGLLNVDVTIPADFFDGLSEQEILDQASESGYTSATINSDGSVTYTMPRSLYNEMLEDMKVNLDDSIAEAIAESPEVFTAISYDADVTSFSVEVNRSAYESSFEAGFIGLKLAFSGLFYQIFAGVPEDDREVTIDFVDGDSGEVFANQVWPQD
jgi:hypothetical protein